MLTLSMFRKVHTLKVKALKVKLYKFNSLHIKKVNAFKSFNTLNKVNVYTINYLRFELTIPAHAFNCTKRGFSS
jgi:hypothetical protein